ncbi:E2.2.1.1 [Lepeophtheirus salmonis]|uniref:transketolase n=1 Tax=Lepeophtheirus salmonis TaxID=72036 RepID=A0A7R8CZH9_LEPSM|nr:E2.2.1.1 [Lepeophtheirus salmonis]CAF2975520.1 E2.2.1.1 [Lepeophtheirus salmonis]
MSQEEIQSLKDVANKLRIHSVESTTAAGSGHPTSCSSMADIMSVLFFKTMKYTVSEPKAANNDPWAEAGLFPTSELMKLRKLESDLEGHPTPRLNFIDVATGSLGQGLSIACGMAYCGMHYDKSPYRTYCLMGDGESMEGNVWEAFNFAGFYKLDNLCAIIDVNRLGQSDPAPLGHDMEAYRLRLNSFGFHSIVVDGHDVGELIRAFDEAEKTKGKPTCILAKTYKGYNFPSVVNQENWHGKKLCSKAPDASNPKIKSPVAVAPIVDISGIFKLSKPPYYRIGDSLATREAYGTGLVKIAQDNDRVVALDGDMKNSTFSLNLRKVMPERHIECFICEQNLAGVGIGLACRDRTLFPKTNVNVVGSHCGVSIGEDGPSQMALEDLSMFRSLPGCTIFYPSDAVSTERAVELAANTLVKQTMSDKVLIIAGGITLQKALEAASELAQSGTNVRVMDIFTVKPVDKEGIIKNATECGNKILTVEDHYPEGGIGDAVLDVISMEDIKLKKLAVREVPRSGPPMVLLEKHISGQTSKQSYHED